MRVLRRSGPSQMVLLPHGPPGWAKKATVSRAPRGEVSGHALRIKDRLPTQAKKGVKSRAWHVFLENCSLNISRWVPRGKGDRESSMANRRAACTSRGVRAVLMEGDQIQII